MDAATSEHTSIEALHKSSLVIIGHDHLEDEASLLSMAPAGLAAKVLHVSLDADAFHGRDRMEETFRQYTGFAVPALIALERVRQIIETHPDKLCLALTSGDIVGAQKAGRSAVILGFEGGKPIEQSLELLHMFHQLGLRMMQLTWAGGNDICDRRDPPT